MTHPLIIANNISVHYQQQPVLKDLSFTMLKGEQWLLTGEAGSGKTTLAKVLRKQIFHTGTVELHFDENAPIPAKSLYVDQWYHFTNRSNVQDFYYQQRYNSSEADDAYTVLEEIRKDFPDIAESAIDDVLEKINLAHRKEVSTLLLSSGEQKRLQLTKAILAKPQLMILDNPFIGLDVATKKNLDGIFTQLVAEGVHIILINDAMEIPSCITHVATLKDGKLDVVAKADFSTDAAATKNTITLDANALRAALADTKPHADFKQAIRFNNVSVKYGDKEILKHINWTVNKGEKWWLQGHNGAGKSTLLSLVTGDNPQAYANEIYLFDKRRGRGESIWDIKQKIGYVSPELHWYFDTTVTCRQAILSGLFDTTGLYRGVTEEQIQKANAWLYLLQIQDIADKRLANVSISQQRIVLLGRAFIKNPPLLILDEPCQGLDDHQTQQFLQLVDVLLKEDDKTLVYVNHRQDQIPTCITHSLVLQKGMEIQTTHFNTSHNKQIIS
ncbi:MAG: ATP-binding cassette domain-containing protein [Filimonas sp.]|nr:ATP-binding cassette domain-containing protein [Filimonas sp.]